MKKIYNFGMIEKLKAKIFTLMMISLSIIVIGVISLFAILNCNSYIRSSKDNINRMTRMRDKPDFQQNLIKPEIQNFINQEQEKVKTHIKNMIIFSSIASGISLIIIYVISKKVSNIIVMPVEDTLEKQKQFISDASHELKTPLAVIEANADVLENEIGDNKWLKYIQNETDSMDKLINELLLLAKIENVDDIKSYEKFNISNQIEMCVSVFESIAYDKKVKIVTRIQKNIILNGNRQDVEHIVSTLLDNAIKHSEPEKEVIIELAKERNNVILQIKNYGVSIPDEQKDKIFERFYRIDKSRNRNEKRYGLGLAIAKSIVLKYKGKIDVECNNGITCFKIVLPSAEICKANFALEQRRGL